MFNTGALPRPGWIRGDSPECRAKVLSGRERQGRAVGARVAGSPDADRRRLWTEWSAAALLSTVLLTTLVATGVTARLDNILYDVGLRFRRMAPRPDIVIVAVDPASLAREGQWPWSRSLEAKLIANIARAGPKGLGCYFLFLLPSNDDQAVHDAMRLTRTYLEIPLPSRSNPTTVKPIRPVPLIVAAAAGLGSADPRPDFDGFVRRARLFDGAGDHPTPRLVLRMARLAGRGPDPDRRPAVNPARLIPFIGRPGAFQTIPAFKVLEGKVAPSVFRNKFVLLGATAPELQDNYPTPMSAAEGMPSVEINANILDSLLTGRGISAASPAMVLGVSVGLLWVVLIALVRLGPRENLRLAGAMTAAPLAASILAVTTPGVWLTPTPYLLTVTILIPYWGWRRLNAASAYFAQELSALKGRAGDAGDPAPRVAVGVGGDVVLQQMMLLEDAKRRISDLRRFVDDILADFPDPVLVVDLDGHILTVNQATRDFARDAGVPVDPGDPIAPLLARIVAVGADADPIWPPATRPGEAAPLAPGRPRTGEGPDGRVYEPRFTQTRSADDRASGWIVHLADITLLVSAMRQREEALQLLSHDMRSPLSAILASLHHPEFHSAPETLRHRIEGQASRGLDLADAFVRLAKAESADYAFEPFDLGHILHDAVDAVWSLAEAGNVRVEIDTDASGGTEHVILADRGLMTRALVNLLENAIKFSPPGERVWCRLTSARLASASAVACEIADRAGGMTRAQRTVLFRRFASGRDPSNGSAGVGLGLALVQAVVTRHAGTIDCESTEGEGTVFTITLPLHEESEAVEARRA